MIRRSPWITLAIFAILAILAWVLLPRIRGEEDVAEVTPTVQPTQSLLYELSTRDVAWIQFADSTGKLVEVERESASDAWVLVGETEETTDSERISSITGVLVNMPAMRSFDVEIGIETVGLDNPAYTITMRTFTGDEIVTKVGNLNAVGSGYYVQVDNEPSVLVAQLVLDEVLSIFSEPPLIATPTPDVTETLLPENGLTPTP